MDLVLALDILGWDGEVLQVKEKFGGLRFYVNSATEEMYRLISEAESQSYEICEECGKPGTLSQKIKGGWMKTLCLECRGSEEL